MARGISEVMRPQAGGGATPITPKNGFSGKSRPQGSRPTMRSRSSGMLSRRSSWKSSGRVPASGLIMFQPQSCRSWMSRISTSSTSPGSAPSTATGPVRMCPGSIRSFLAWTSSSSGGTWKLALVRHHVRAAADGVDRDLIAAGDGEHRFQFGFEKTPVAGLGAGMQVVMRHEGLSRRFQSSLPGDSAKRVFGIVTRQSIFFEQCILRREMDTRVKPAYDDHCAVGRRSRPREISLCFFCFPRPSASCCCRPIS